MKINSLTYSEELLMNILWKLDSAYMKDVMEAYPSPKPHQNTVSTFMKILVEKEFLTTEKVGRIFKYSVAIPYSDYLNFVLSNFVATYFDNSGLDLVKYLMDERLVTQSDLRSFLKPNTSEAPDSEGKEKSPLSEFIKEITSDKKAKKKLKKKEKKKKK